MRPIVFLMGPPGCGKTTVGKLLGKFLGRPVVDVDNDVLEPFWGQPVSHVAQVLPADDFVRSEAMIFEAALPRLPRQSVISLSGSNPLHEESFARVREGQFTVFLDTPHEEIVSRMGDMLTGRIAGLGEDGGEDALRSLLLARHPVYARSCDLRYAPEAGESPVSIARGLSHIVC